MKIKAIAGFEVLNVPITENPECKKIYYLISYYY
jgi:hypothetical protein